MGFWGPVTPQLQGLFTLHTGCFELRSGTGRDCHSRDRGGCCAGGRGSRQHADSRGGALGGWTPCPCRPSLSTRRGAELGGCHRSRWALPGGHSSPCLSHWLQQSRLRALGSRSRGDGSGWPGALRHGTPPEPPRQHHVAPRHPPPGSGGGRERPDGQRAPQEEPRGRQGRLLLALEPCREAEGR